MPEAIASIPADCASAKDTYGKLFREGAGRGLADVVVGVTGYAGYVPEESPAQVADASGCAWNARTYVLTFGQSLDVRSRDSRPYVPDLMGAKLKAQLVALPRGDAIHLYPEQPGRYQLTDSMRLFMLADVVVVKFPTHAVTGLDGRYVIPRVPVGKVKVSALLARDHGAERKRGRGSRRRARRRAAHAGLRSQSLGRAARRLPGARAPPSRYRRKRRGSEARRGTPARRAKSSRR